MSRGKSKKSGSHRVRICGFSNGIYTDAEPVIFRAGSVRCEYGKGGRRGEGYRARDSVCRADEDLRGHV